MNWSTKQLAEVYRGRGDKSPIESACGNGSKYRAEPCVVDGIRFDSRREARHWRTLKIAQEAGAISQLKRQVRFLLLDKLTLPDGRKQRAMSYVADFTFMQDGALVAVDSKGFRTQAYQIKAKLFRAKYPDVRLEEW